MKRGYCFTINNYTDFDCACVVVMFDDSVYGIAGFEVGENGTPHIQGYVYFENKKSFDAIKDYIPTAHVEDQKGTPSQASVYCKKDGDYYEVGVLPVKGSRTDIKVIHQMCVDGVSPEEIIQNVGGLHMYKSICDYSMVVSQVKCVPEIVLREHLGNVYEEMESYLEKYPTMFVWDGNKSEYRGEDIYARHVDPVTDMLIRKGLGVDVMVGYRKIKFYPKVYIV